MSIDLKSIELSNFRHHSYLQFEPSAEGVTAISGPNGAGKSTLVDATAWVLYGTKPEGVKKTAELHNDQAEFEPGKCYVRLQLVVDGETLKVERRMVAKGGAMEADVWRFVDGDWEHVAGSSVSHVEKYVTKRIKMDEKGFLTTILVQQKQVDKLVLATPRERGLVIEDLTGITAITKGLVTARKEYNELRKAAKNSTASADELAEAQAKAESLALEVENEKSEYYELKSAARESATALKELEEKYETETEKREHTESTRSTIARLEVEIESLSTESERLLAERKELKPKLPRGSSTEALKTSRRRVAELQEAIAAYRHEVRNLTKRVKQVERAREALEESAGSGVSEESLTNGLQELAEKLVTLESESEGFEATITAARTTISSLKGAIEVIDSEEQECPTCLQKVREPDAALKSLRDSLKVEQNKGRTASKSLAATTKAIGECKTEKEELQASLMELKSHAKEVAEGEGVQRALVEAEGGLKASQAELTQAEKTLRGLEHQESQLREYKALRERSDSLLERLEGKQKELREAKEELSESSSLTDAQYRRLQTKYFTLRDAHQDKRTRLSALKSNVRLKLKDQEHTDKLIGIYDASVKKHEALLESVEIAAHTVQVIDEFRSTRMKTALPALETYASELVSRFTEGHITQLTLDEKFNASVTMFDGKKRAIGLLSGGELSAAAISLRLAVAMLLNSSSSHNLLILDEILVSQDAERTEKILATLKDVCKGQVIIIAHNDNISSIADSVFEIPHEG